MSIATEVQSLKAKLPFTECKTIAYDESNKQLTFELTFNPPHHLVQVKLSHQYIESYPNGSVSMMVGNHFHVVPVGSQLTLRDLSLKVKDMCRAAMSAESGVPFCNGLPIESPEPGMRTPSTEWAVEPTVDIGSAHDEYSGVNPYLLADVTAAQSSKHLVVMKDAPALGTTTVMVMIDIKPLISGTTASAWNMMLNEPLQLHLVCDRQKYLDAPVAIEVGQSQHFNTGLFHGMTGQLRSIMNGFVKEVCAQKKAKKKEPLDVLIEHGCSKEVAEEALKLTDNHIVQAVDLVVHNTKEAIMSGEAIETMGSGDSVTSIKTLPPATDGFFARAADYLVQRLPTAPEFCVMCDKPHLFGQGQMLQSSVCTRDLCVFKFQELNVGRDVANSIAVQTGVVDLLVTCARHACQSSRWQHIFNPFPHICTTSGAPETDHNKMDIGAAKRIIHSIPPLKSIAGAVSKGSMKSALEVADPKAYDMFQWIINSNKSFLLKIPSENHIQFMGTSHQYILATAPPARQQRFSELKAKHGASWAFHGSRPENWHSILRNGLKNASGTKLQVNGAAYGNGIYLSPSAGVSFGYSNISTYESTGSAVSTLDKEYLDSGSMHCIAVCEVIESSLKKSGNIWVQEHEDHVITRFFFVYTLGMSKGGSTDLTRTEFTKVLDDTATKFIR